MHAAIAGDIFTQCRREMSDRVGWENVDTCAQVMVFAGGHHLMTEALRRRAKGSKIWDETGIKVKWDSRELRNWYQPAAGMHVANAGGAPSCGSLCPLS